MLLIPASGEASSDELLRLLQSESTQGLIDPDAVPEPPDEATTQPGDLWLLGKHRLLCGDSSRPEDVDRLLAGAAIHLVNTDPPYNVRVEPRSNNAIDPGLSSFQGTTHRPPLENLVQRLAPPGEPHLAQERGGGHPGRSGELMVMKANPRGRLPSVASSGRRCAILPAC